MQSACHSYCGKKKVLNFHFHSRSQLITQTLTGIKIHSLFSSISSSLPHCYFHSQLLCLLSDLTGAMHII
ncbi:hypothetical protein S83_017732 [Arachis hypogaea]